MSPTFDQKIALFHRSAIQQMKRAGLSAYILRDDGSVIRFKPDGKRELIVSSSAFRGHVKSGACALPTG